QFYRVDDTQRLDACLRLLYCQRPQAAVIFCNTRSETAELARQLQQHGIDALALHGDMEQRDRDQALMQLANHSVVVLVATDVAARGLDISALDLVINYRMARDRETHTHRIGRTGRAGEQGLACTLVDADEQHRLALLLDQDIEPLPLPDAPARPEPLQAAMVTLQMDGGKKQKIRPADILGALTANPAIDGSQIGKIRVLPLSVTVAVRREIATVALATLQQQPVKGRMRRVRRLRH
ncbi:MAG TPA: helicase-related protein, partial [Pseudomonadales bacterium]